MANILIGATGSVAAKRVPEMAALLRQAGLRVKVVATHAALYFFDPAAIRGEDSLCGNPLLDAKDVFVDEDEWPGRTEGKRYERDDPVLHIELRRWADLLLLAPLDANTLAKLANGLADNCLTCVWRAWGPARPVVLAPAMNTLMWQHPLTARHLRQLIADGESIPPGLDQDGVAQWLNEHAPKLRVVVPQVKRLACGDVGTGALADLGLILTTVQDMLPVAKKAGEPGA